MSATPKSVVMPPPLRPGDPVGVIAPAGAVDPAALESGLERLKAMGHEPVFLESIFDRDGYFAGSVDRRVNELHEMFRRDEVKAIIAARGGYGCNYLLPFLDLDLIREHHKPLIGYSDLTTLHTWLSDNGLGTFHGPMVAKDFANEDGVDVAWWNRVLAGEDAILTSKDVDGSPLITEGKATGKLYGGCLSLMVQSLGTPYSIDPQDSILFIEDIGVWPYQVDRMLMHLKMSGNVDRIRGIIFGDMARCAQDGLPDYTVGAIAKKIFGDMGIPIVMGVRSGHVEGGNITLPLGTPVSLDATDVGFTLTVHGWTR